MDVLPALSRPDSLVPRLEGLNQKNGDSLSVGLLKQPHLA